MSEDNCGIVLSHHVYRALLVLYPRSFRREYGREMALAFRDICRRVVRREGTAGLLDLWLVTIADLMTTALKERLTEVTEMSNSLLVRLCGVAGAAGGLILVVVGVMSLTSDWSDGPYDWVVAIYGPALLLGTIGFASLRSYETLGRIGLGLALLGALLVCAGAFAMFVVDIGGDWAWTVWFGGTMLQLAGLVAFGASVLTSRALPRGNSLPLLAGAVPLVLFILTINSDWGYLTLLIYGLGWAALGGLLVWTAGEDPAPLSPAV